MNKIIEFAISNVCKIIVKPMYSVYIITKQVMHTVLKMSKLANGVQNHLATHTQCVQCIESNTV